MPGAICPLSIVFDIFPLFSPHDLPSHYWRTITITFDQCGPMRASPVEQLGETGILRVILRVEYGGAELRNVRDMGDI